MSALKNRMDVRVIPLQLSMTDSSGKLGAKNNDN
jgi:hypothetical protein